MVFSDDPTVISREIYFFFFHVIYLMGVLPEVCLLVIYFSVNNSLT